MSRNFSFVRLARQSVHCHYDPHQCHYDALQLHRVSSGSLTAIMGASGSGKSTLLDLIAGRQQDGIMTGTLLANGCMIGSHSDFGKLVAYMPQLDVMWPQLTVREQCDFAAKFKLPRNVGADEEQHKVTSIIEELGLQNCANTKTGGAQQRQNEEVSGGERKRTSVACELVSDPAVLLLDEPLSGLDSHSAMAVTGMMRALADQGRIVVATLHQVETNIVIVLNVCFAMIVSNLNVCFVAMIVMSVI
jgi:ABC-type multidrug transport system ATPase subunit